MEAQRERTLPHPAWREETGKWGTGKPGMGDAPGMSVLLGFVSGLGLLCSHDCLGTWCNPPASDSWVLELQTLATV